MYLFKQVVLIPVGLSILGLSGCSVFQNSENHYRDNYRGSETEMVQTLEMPPNLFNPVKVKPPLSNIMVEQEEHPQPELERALTIPTFQAEGLAIKSNLSERWLEVDSVDSEQVWLSIKRFLHSFGFTVAQERKDIGVLKTEYLKRTELVPMDDVGLITQLLNSWRPELAEGVYDKFVVRVETDTKTQVTRVYFSHHMLYSPDTNEAMGGENHWKIKPYRPEMEAQALYQAMVFLGAKHSTALTQLKASEHQIELVEGEELAYLILQANLETSWNYLQAMIYRADWSMVKSLPLTHTILVELPDSIRQEKTLFSRLAFWKSSEQMDLPKVVRLTLEGVKEELSKTRLSVQSLDGESPLDGTQKRYIFEHLGLLAQ